MTTSQIRNRIVALREVRAGDLVPHAKNWRRHPSFQKDVLEGLLSEIGYADALIAFHDGEDLVVIDGHLRRSLDPDQLVPVLELDLSPAEAELLLATLDPVATLAKTDPEALASLHADVKTSSEAVKELLASIEREARVVAQGRADPDDVPEVDTPRAQRGDVWAVGDHVVICGDASAGMIWSLIEPIEIDAVWTDPPYGVNYTGRTADALTIANDRAEDVPGLLSGTFAELDRHLVPGAAVYVARPSTGSLGVAFGQAFLAQGWTIAQELVWVKDRIVIGHTDYHFRHESLVYGRKPGRARTGRGRHGWYGGNAEASVFEIARPAVSSEHPTAKPVELVRRCLANSSVRGATVADPFVGSGTTLIACEQLGRRCIGIELDPRYVDVTITRWERFTGEQAARRG